jgi:hypothetical protein
VASSAMPLYFFHLRAANSVDDIEGRELPDLEAAQRCALIDARAIICADVDDGFLDLNDAIEIADGSGASLSRLAFRDVFQLRGSY